jgi:hypothetical protein
MPSRTITTAVGTMAVGLVLAAAAPAPARDQRIDPQTLKATGEPRQCVQSRDVQTTVAGENAIMFRLPGGQWLRNDLRGSCPLAAGISRVLVFRSTIGQRCALDLFDVVDPASRITLGSCTLGEFTPVEVPRGTRF